MLLRYAGVILDHQLKVPQSFTITTHTIANICERCYSLIVQTFYKIKVHGFLPRFEESLRFTTLKKAILDCEILNNFRPVSDLSFLSKLVERIVYVQLVDHLKAHHLYEVFQSAYRQLHNTETALRRVQNDLLRAVDTHGGAILLLLDLSAAFDTIDHQRLLHTLESSFGIKGKVLDRIKSYLTGRTQTVQIKKSTSEPHELKCGVPQGSVLGPILFIIYTTPLGQLIRIEAWSDFPSICRRYPALFSI